MRKNLSKLIWEDVEIVLNQLPSMFIDLAIRVICVKSLKNI